MQAGDMLAKFDGLVARLVVDTDRMAANLESTRGLVNSQAVLLALIERGHTRDDAYRIVQRNAMRAWDEGLHLRDLLGADPEVDLSDGELEGCFLPERFLRNTAPVFDRLEALSLVR